MEAHSLMHVGYKMKMARIFKKRRLIALIMCLAFIGTLVMTLTGPNPNADPEDYDYDIGSPTDRAWIRAVQKNVNVVYKSRDSAMEENQIDVLTVVDRKPKEVLNLDVMNDDIYEAGAFRRVIFNKQDLPVFAKRIAFIYPSKKNPGNKQPLDNVEGREEDLNYTDSEDREDDDEDVGDEEEYDYWANPNQEFRPGDFDALPGQPHKPVRFKPENPAYEEEAIAGEEQVEMIPPNPLLNTRALHSQLEYRSSYPGDNKKHKTSSIKGFQANLLPDPQDHINRSKTASSIKCNGSGRCDPQSQPFNLLPAAGDINKNIAKSRHDEFKPLSKVNFTSDRKSSKANLLKLTKSEQQATQLQMPELMRRPGNVLSNGGFPLVQQHIYWTSEVENFLPTGINETALQEFTSRLQKTPIADMQEPLWNRCGRPKNQFIILQDDTRLCARYRHPHNALIKGEVLTFYLSRLLGLDNIPAVVLSRVNTSKSQWRKANLTKAGWEDGQIIAMIQWIEGLNNERSHLKMPPVILSAYQKGNLITGHHPALPLMSPTEVTELLQWGDMFVLDYITGHYDRVASMQDGADRERKPSILTENIRNLRQADGKMWLIDNESGLLDAYELLYQGRMAGKQFIRYHKHMLQTMCIFRESLIRNIQKLANMPEPDVFLESFVMKNDPLYQLIPHDRTHKLFKLHFKSRLKEVMNWVNECQTR